MNIYVVIALLVASGALVVVLSRLGSTRHQEDLNTHDGGVGRDDLGGPVRDRPAGAGAEAMGVDEPGESDPGSDRG